MYVIIYIWQIFVCPVATLIQIIMRVLQKKKKKNQTKNEKKHEERNDDNMKRFSRKSQDF